MTSIKFLTAPERLLLLFMLFVPINQGISQNPASANGSVPEITTLETINTFAAQWCCANGGYLYGRDARNRARILRKSENAQTYETRGVVSSLNPAFKIEDKIFSTTTPGLIFIPVMDSSVFFLLKSSDGGATFRKVFTFGEGNGPSGTNAKDVRLLRGLLELTTELPGGGGVGTLLIGEYNVGHSRIPGSTNDRIRIMKSVDNGESWTKVTEWNTNGSNQVGHIHAMVQDPYTGEIYVCTGDNNNKAGIIKWDGSSPWPDNKSLSELKSISGFKVLTGSQRYRACDVLFDENYFYTFSDTQTPNNPTGSESGIWRGSKDFSSFIRKDNQIFKYDPMHIGWFGAKIGNTFIFTTSREYVNPANGWKKLNTQVYTSTDGIHWYASGVINWRDTGDPTASRYINSVFTWNDKLYIDCAPGAGHSSTIQCDLSGKWKTCEDPVILHPVYFVGNWNAPGNNANPGTNPDAPKKTLAGALHSNAISAGARVRVAKGTFYETNIYPDWSAAVLQGRGSVVIEGQGSNETHIVRESGTPNTDGLRIEASRTLTDDDTPLIIKNLEFYITADGEPNHANYLLNNIDSYIKTIDCKIGNANNDDSPLINLNNEGAKYVSVNSVHIANSASSIYKSIVRSGSANTVYQFQNCIFLNAYDAFADNFPGIQLSLKNCDFYNIEHAGILLGSEWNTQPFIKNCIFSCGEAPIIDLSGLTETDIDYNLYNREVRDIIDGGHSLAVGTDPLFVDPLTGNLNIKSNSPCKLKGTYLSDVLYDCEYKERIDPPCIGAFENIDEYVAPVLTVSHDSIIIDQSASSSVTFTINSNTEWTVSSDSAWINLSESSGTGNDTITVSSVTSNNSLNTRSAKIFLTASDAVPVTVTVIQKGEIPALSVASGEITIAPEIGSTGNIIIISNTEWTVTSDQSWFNLSSSSGSGNGNITITATNRNHSVFMRNSALTFSANNIPSVTVLVTQAGEDPSLTVTPEINIGPASGETAELDVVSNTDWSITYDDPWVNLSSVSGSGNGTITITASGPNQSIVKRTSTLTLSAAGVTPVTVLVTQAGEDPSLMVTPEITIGAASGEFAELDVVSNTDWSIKCDDPWVNLSSVSGSGRGIITITATSQNHSILTRTSTLTFSANGIQPVTTLLTQSGESPELTVTPEITISSESGATGQIIISSNTDWYISTPDTWLILSSVSGTGNGIVTVMAGTQNNSTAPRDASLIFSAAGTSSVTGKVIQSGEIPTGINLTEKLTLKTYPNPVSDILTIEYNDDSFKSINILNANGNILTKEKVTGPIQYLDFSQYEYGFYILEFVGPQGNKKVKIIYR